MRKQLLVGATTDNELVFANLEVRTWNGHPEFSASFDTVHPFNMEEIDLEEMAKNYLEGCDREMLYDLCEEYDCSPSNLLNVYAKNTSIDEIMDLSLYSNYINIDGAEWRFKSSGCGQQDTRNNMNIYVNKKLYNRIIKLWDKYHLKEISEDIQEEIEKIITQLEEIEEEQWIRDYIKMYII